MKKIFTLFAALAMVMSMSAATWTVAGEPAAVFHDQNWSCNAAANDMVQQADGTFKWERTDLSLAANTTIKFKVCKDHGWTTAYPGNDYELKIQKSGLYTITITFNPSGNTVNATATLLEEQEVIATVAVKGAWDSWSKTTAFTLAEDKKTAATTISIAKTGEFEFGLEVSGGFIAEKNVITREANVAEGLDSNTGNMKLTVDVAGDYTFTWEYATKNLTVTYPALSTPKYTVTLSDNTGGFEPLTSGAGEYEEGDEVTVSAIDSDGWVFVGWMDENGDIVSNDYQYTFVIESNVELVAIYAQLMELEVKDLQIITDPVVGLLGSAELMPGMKVTFNLVVDDSEQGDDGEYYLTEDSKVYLNEETELEFQEGIALIDMMSYIAQAQVLVAMEESLILFKLDMSAAAEPEEIDIVNAVATYNEGSGELFLTATWTDSDEVTYPVTITLAGYEYKEESVIYSAPDVCSVQIGGDGDDDPWYTYATAQEVVVTIEDQQIVIEGEEFTSPTGDSYYIMITGTLPAKPQDPTALDNVNTTVAPAKAIVNGQLVILKDGVKYNAQGAQL